MKLRGANILLGSPGGDIDGHAHVFERTLELAPGRRYAPSRDALLSTYVDHLRNTHLSGGLLVQPSFLGTDNSYLLAALAAVNTQRETTRNPTSENELLLRGVVTLAPDATPEQMTQLQERGIVGMRFNLFGKGNAYEFDIDAWRSVIKHANKLGWHIDVHCEGPHLANVLPQLLAHADRVTIDHFGLPDPTAPMSCPGQAALLAAPQGRVFIKTSGPYRVFRDRSSEAAAQSCTPIFARLLQELGPDQLMWGSDWPWTQFEDRHDFATTRRWLDNWVTATNEHERFRAPEFTNLNETSRSTDTLTH